MSNKKNLKVLSLNVYIMGHITYQDTLEKTFPQHIPEVEFQSLHLPDCRDFLSRAMFWLLIKRLPGSGKADYDFFRLRGELSLSFYAYRYLNSVLKTCQPDVIHIHTQGIALLAAPLFRRFPCVVSIDNTTALLAAEHPKPAHITYQPIVALERKCFQAATHIMTFSDRARNSVINHYSIAPEKVTTVHSGIPLELFTRISRSKSSNQSKPRLLFVGNDFERKGGNDLVAVFLEHFSDTCELDLVTNDPPVNLPTLPNVRVHRQVTPLSPELLHLYQMADIFVLPTHEDCFGWVFIEAMAAGLPCIGTTTMAVPELVRNGYSGFTITPRDRQALLLALHKLIYDDELRLSMGLAGRDIAIKNFSNVTNCKRMAEVFYNCI